MYISAVFIMFINISLQITDTFYKLLSIGLSVAYGVQVILCVGGVVKFIPHTGVTLPLISYGGKFNSGDDYRVCSHSGVISA